MTADTEAVVLFGAGGFVGRNIVSALQESVPTMYGVTRTGSPVAGCTLTLPGDRLEELPALPTETVVINVASHRYDASTYQADQAEVLSRNTFITDRVYRFCIERSLTEVRAASSSAVYPASWTILDDTKPIDLNEPVHGTEIAYAWSKRWAEILADVYRQLGGINTISFRLTNPYGPFDTLCERAAHVVTAFVIRALSDAPTFRIQGNPDGERDFVFAGDIADVFRLSLSRRGLHDAMNLAWGQTISVRALAIAAMKAAGSERPLDVAQAGTGAAAVRVRWATGARLREIFPELPRFRPLAEGLAATVAWYRDALVR